MKKMNELYIITAFITYIIHKDILDFPYIQVSS